MMFIGTILGVCGPLLIWGFILIWRKYRDEREEEQAALRDTTDAVSVNSNA